MNRREHDNFSLKSKGSRIQRLPIVEPDLTLKTSSEEGIRSLQAEIELLASRRPRRIQRGKPRT